MASPFTREQLLQARQADLYTFLIYNHLDLFVMEGNALRMRDNHSVYIKRGWHSFRDFSSGTNGNSVDFLCQYLGYSLNDAVLALTQGGSVTESIQKREVHKAAGISLPTPQVGRFSRLFSYLLCDRGLKYGIVQTLCDRGLLYESAETHNAVFINAERDYGEIHGTIPGTSFKGLAEGSKSDSFWYFTPPGIMEKPNRIYVCEAAIDAISLWQLKKESAFYASIGGASNQQRIERMKKSRCQIIIATDNDKAGQECRDRNKDLMAIIPCHKDWNEDLLENRIGGKENG